MSEIHCLQHSAQIHTHTYMYLKTRHPIQKIYREYSFAEAWMRASSFGIGRFDIKPLEHKILQASMNETDVLVFIIVSHFRNT